MKIHSDSTYAHLHNLGCLIFKVFPLLNMITYFINFRFHFLDPNFDEKIFILDYDLSVINSDFNT
jgi:hypothetical protein